jgi:hypothetical protein
MDGKRPYFFIRFKDNQAFDILAPDHSPPGWRPNTVAPRQTIQVAGGNQCLQRLAVISLTKTTTDVPVPSVLGSLILTAAACKLDGRDRDRHATDAAFTTDAFLASLITDPLDLAGQFKGSDRMRLRVLNALIGLGSHPVWATLGCCPKPRPSHLATAQPREHVHP